MKISIIIPTYNRADQIVKMLDSVVMQDYPKSEFEILVIDNNSSDNTKSVILDYCKKYAEYNIKYIFEPVSGLISGRHRGAKESTGEILIFCDDDIQLSGNNVLQIVADTFVSNQNIGLIGAKYIPAYQEKPAKWFDYFWMSTPYGGKMCWELSLLDLGDKMKTIDARFVWGLFYVIRRDILFEYEGFHPDACPIPYLRGDGETGLSDKINKNSSIITVYKPEITILHEVPVSRMTEAYFLKRSYSQGLSDSYTDIRNGKREIELYKPQKRKLRWHVKCFLKNGYWALYAKKLKEECQEKQQEGYCFHNNAALNNPEILEWVLKPDYWDYKYPIVSEIKGIAEMPDKRTSLHR